MSKRIYVVTNNETDAVQLIRAANTTQARNAAAKQSFNVSLATQDDLVSLVGEGVRVVDAVADEPMVDDRQEKIAA